MANTLLTPTALTREAPLSALIVAVLFGVATALLGAGVVTSVRVRVG